MCILSYTMKEPTSVNYSTPALDTKKYYFHPHQLVSQDLEAAERGGIAFLFYLVGFLKIF